MIFYTDGLLVPDEKNPALTGKTRRFFKMITKLPLEMQMVLCHRMFGSPRDVISGREAEPAFKWLVRQVLRPA